MKKVFSILAIAVVATFVACGPSAEEKAKLEEAAKLQADSIAAAMEAQINAAATQITDSAAATTTEAVETATAAATEAAHGATEAHK